MRKKRIIAIYNKITQIAQKGSFCYIEYYNYIDDIISNEEYVFLQDVFSIYFNTDIRMYKSITILKQKSWIVALSNTDTSFMYRLKSFYDANNVYQVGQNIYDVTTNEYLGKFVEVDRIEEVNYLGITYSIPPKYELYRNTDLYKILYQPKEIILKIEVGNHSYDMNVYLKDANMVLLDKYKIGVDILITRNPSVNQYVFNDYIDDYFE